MIGDGVNDLPAIKASDMGIAMEEGSKITKEVADIVLLKNRFALLPSIFDEGNKIVNTVSAMAKLFLTKNFVVIYLALLHIFFLFNFPLTPRRVSLINIFAIALPSFFIALRNNNTGKTLNFTRDLYSFVVVSALFMIGAGFIGEYLTKKYYAIRRERLTDGLAEHRGHYLYGQLLRRRAAQGRKERPDLPVLRSRHLTIYTFLATSQLNFFLLKWLKIFLRN